MNILILPQSSLTENEKLFLQECIPEMEKEHSVDVHNRLFDDNNRCILCLLGSACVASWMKKKE